MQVSCMLMLLLYASMIFNLARSCPARTSSNLHSFGSQAGPTWPWPSTRVALTVVSPHRSQLITQAEKPLAELASRELGQRRIVIRDDQDLRAHFRYIAPRKTVNDRD